MYRSRLLLNWRKTISKQRPRQTGPFLWRETEWEQRTKSNRKLMNTSKKPCAPKMPTIGKTFTMSLTRFCGLSATKAARRSNHLLHTTGPTWAGFLFSPGSGSRRGFSMPKIASPSISRLNGLLRRFNFSRCKHPRKDLKPRYAPSQRPHL